LGAELERAAVYASANRAAARGFDCDLEDAAAYTYTETAAGVDVIEREAEAAGRAGLPATVIQRG
jgi:hypothetical protein